MVIFGDYHTHTIYSHGKGDILDNAKVAKAKHLKEIAITDHGFNHKLFGVKRDNLCVMREKIIKAEKETGVKSLLGVEANFVSLDGTIDVTKEDREKLDIVLVGFHRFVKCPFSQIFKLFLPNMLGIKTKKQIQRNTNMVINAVNKNKIDVLTHLNYGFKVDIKKLAPILSKTNTAVEINGRKNCLSTEELLILANNNVKMILNSDAHTPEKVGEVNIGQNLVEKLNLPHNLIVNLDKTFKLGE